MTKKDYILIANNIKYVKYCNDHIQKLSASDAIETIAKVIANDLKEDNEKFDRDKFLTACGFTG